MTQLILFDDFYKELYKMHYLKNLVNCPASLA